MLLQRWSGTSIVIGCSGHVKTRSVADVVAVAETGSKEMLDSGRVPWAYSSIGVVAPGVECPVSTRLPAAESSRAPSEECEANLLPRRGNEDHG